MPAALEPALPCAPRGGSGEGTVRSTFRASGGTGLFLNASLQRAWTDGLLTERRRCSLTGLSERQAELEICGPLLKSARGVRCTRRGPDRVRAEPRGRADAPDAGPTHRGAGWTPWARSRHTALFPAALSSPCPFLGTVEPGCSLGRAESRRGLTSKPTGTTWLWGAGSASRPALRSCETGAPGPAPGPTWGAWGSGRPPHRTAPEGQG